MPHYINAGGQIISPELNGVTNHLLRSNDVTEIIAHKPAFLIRWGISIFFLVLVMIMAATFFIHFPDVVPAKAKLTALNAPKEVKAKTGGRLVALKVTEQQHVNKNQVLGFIESNADHNEVIMLAGITDTLQSFLLNNKTEQLPAYLTAPLQHLGEVQQSYQSFIQAFVLFRQYLSTGYYLKKKAMLQKDMAYLSRQYANLLQQRGLQQQDVELAKATFAANESLKNDSVISAFDYRNEKSKYINKALSIPQINSTLLNNESSRHEKQKEIAQLENEIAQQKTVFLQALNTFKAQLDEWKQKYLLIAPIDGMVAFAGFVQENQQLEANRSICYINPENTSYYAEVYIPQNNFGKVKQGQKVLLKLPAYPYQEFGSLEGRLEFIANIATDSGYIAKVTFPGGLKTNYNKPVQYKDGLLAQGEIITADLKLSDRLINSVKQVFTKQ